MQETTQISAFGSILLFLVLGTGFVLITLFMSALISPHKPNSEKLTSYECGEEPTGSSWMQFNMRFYVVALVFLLFDVELVFLFPWATVFGQKALIAAAPAWGWLSFIEMSIFIGILLVGLLYVWKKGDIDWIKPQPLIPTVDVKIPMNLYAELNKQKHNLRSFESQTLKEAAVKVETAEIVSASPRKAIFKSAMAGKLTADQSVVESPQSEEPSIIPPNEKFPNEKAETGKPNATPYKPKFKPQIKSEVNNTEEPNNVVPNDTLESPSEMVELDKPAATPYKPKFKPQMVKKTETAKEDEAPIVNEKKEESSVEAKSAAAPYKPKFKPQMLKKTETAKEVEEPLPVINETKEEITEEKKVATPYKPKFRPQMLKKPDQPSNTEDTPDVKNEE